MTTVLLVRHGATDWNLALRAQGHADIPLNEKGTREARAAAQQLAGLEVHAVYSSDLRRALDTAREIAAPHGLEPVVDRALREIDQGEWTGLNNKEILARWPGMWEARHHTARPGGESPADVRRRALAALARIVGAHPHDTVVLVSHGVTIRALVAEALGYTERDAGRLRGLGNGGVVRFDVFSDAGRLSFEGFERLDGRTPAVQDPNA